jgi:DNA phosphorothioation-dependent restriction protein DptG
MSVIIRDMIKQQLEIESAKESMDFIRENINDEIKSICLPKFERTSKLIAKIGFQSVSNFYLLVQIMSDIMPNQKRNLFNKVCKKSKMMAIAYLKLNQKNFAEFMESEDEGLEYLKF